MLTEVLETILLALVFVAPPASAQVPNAAALKPSLAALSEALQQRDMTPLMPMLDSSFRVGDFTGDMARGVLRQVIGAGRVIPESIRVDGVRTEGQNLRVNVTFMLPGGDRAYDLLVTKEGHFVEINLMRLQPAAGTVQPGTSGAAGVSLGAAPGAGAGTMAAAADPTLRAELIAMLQDDQRYRGEISSAQKRGDDMQSVEMKRLRDQQVALDIAALAHLQRILDARGWPTAALVGPDARAAAFLVLQHAPVDVQERYLPMARAAAAAGELEGSSLALLEDRVLVERGKKQIYGTQVHMNPATKQFELRPIENEVNVDTRRKAIGLGPLADYLKLFNIRYEPVRK